MTRRAPRSGGGIRVAAVAGAAMARFALVLIVATALMAALALAGLLVAPTARAESLIAQQSAGETMAQTPQPDASGTATGPATGTEAPKRLMRVAYSSGWDALPLIVAIERGFFDGQGLIASPMATGSAAAVVNSLAVGSTDLGVVPQRTFIAMAAADLPVKAVAVASWAPQMQLVARAEAGIVRVADLAGRRIALTQGSAGLAPLVRLLDLSALRPADVTLRVVSVGDLAGVFKAAGPARDRSRIDLSGMGGSGPGSRGTGEPDTGEQDTGEPDTGKQSTGEQDMGGQGAVAADAVFEIAHFTGPMVASGRAVPVLGPQDVATSLGFVGAMPVVANDRVIADNPGLVRRAVAAIADAQAYIHANPDDAARVLRIFLHRQGVRAADGVVARWVGLQRYDRTAWTAAAIEDLAYNAWALAEAGVIPAEPADLTGFIDRRFAEYERHADAGKTRAPDE
ncbi:hypothetical protein CCR85_10855 [Rhodothalassium salexigens]|uniref:ABC transporter substrate-binding protein n=1 Tax=Rhodothalassium salexigens TaxID=1086 RepID=UPI001913EAEE|nr:ABC transporter substrate-binding protein [Rhodothalassium salexigens]MBK5911988.1 hypothetical protein [Rhodothalassium salexigens]MBK5922152.1 hypothetical protein [Rhodothalassium salexigens]